MGSMDLISANTMLKTVYGAPIKAFEALPPEKVKRLSRKKLLEYTARLAKVLEESRADAKYAFEKLGKEEAKTATLFEVVRIATAHNDR